MTSREQAMGVLMKSKTTQIDCEGQARAEGGGLYPAGTATGVEVESANPTWTKAQLRLLSLS